MLCCRSEAEAILVAPTRSDECKAQKSSIRYCSCIETNFERICQLLVVIMASEVAEKDGRKNVFGALQ